MIINEFSSIDMKHLYLFIFLLLFLTTSLMGQNTALTGAWESGPAENHITMILTGRYWTAVVTNKTNNTYVGTCGGTWRSEKDQGPRISVAPDR